MNAAKRVCIFMLIIVFIIVFSGCGLKKTAEKLSKAAKELSETRVETGTMSYTGEYAGNRELEWDEKAMYGLKFPGGTIEEHFVESGLDMYIIRDITFDQIKACIQDMKDLGFTVDAWEFDNSYI